MERKGIWKIFRRQEKPQKPVIQPLESDYYTKRLSRRGVIGIGLSIAAVGAGTAVLVSECGPKFERLGTPPSPKKP